MYAWRPKFKLDLALQRHVSQLASMLQDLKACLPFPYTLSLSGNVFERLVAIGLVAKLHVMSQGFLVSFCQPVCHALY